MGLNPVIMCGRLTPQSGFKAGSIYSGYPRYARNMRPNILYVKIFNYLRSPFRFPTFDIETILTMTVQPEWVFS